MIYDRGDISGALSSLSAGFKSLTGTEKTMDQKVSQKGNLYADIICLTGCKDNQTSADASFQGRNAGAMTYSLLKALSMYPNLTYGQLLIVVRDILKGEFSQVPQLSTSRMFNMNETFKMYLNLAERIKRSNSSLEYLS